MCTVTLTPQKADIKGFVLTSNRDEAPGRKTLPPKVCEEQGVKMVFPKDEVAGGTWLGVSEQQRLVCLLNGGFVKHMRTPPYRLSRGVVVKDLLATPDYDLAAEEYDLHKVEPFTIIMVEWKEQLRFQKMVWDGKQKHFRELPLQEHIWSSSPLYSEEMKNLREKWFQQFRDSGVVTPESLLSFHSSAGIGDKNVDVIMDRGFVKTQSISQIVHSEDKTSFYYRDLTTEEVSKMIFSDTLEELI
ncbi:NRDE family protein [Salinimicrobium soli]|uniref:NRDE family protein n=1 Tax=Salinimicrobium soli TaxID=1254399 RepID=UPI003AB10432